MDILNAVCKVVALILNSLSIWDKMSTYLLEKKNPSKGGRPDGLENKSQT